MKAAKFKPVALLAALIATSPVSHAEFINGHEWVLNLEYRKFTPVNEPISRRVYICDTAIAGNCEDSAAWNTLVAEEGWEVAPARVRLFDSGTNDLPTPPEGVPGVIDFNGYQLQYGADVTEAALVGFGPNGPLAVAQVERATVLTWNAGKVMHEVIDDSGNKYVLFTAMVQVAQAVDLTLEGALAEIVLPAGWSYSSRTLSEDLHVSTAGSNGIATVFSTPATSWQLYSTAEVPLPAAAWLFGSALLGLGLNKRQRKS